MPQSHWTQRLRSSPFLRAPLTAQPHDASLEKSRMLRTSKMDVPGADFDIISSLLIKRGSERLPSIASRLTRLCVCVLEATLPGSQGDPSIHPQRYIVCQPYTVAMR